MNCSLCESGRFLLTRNYMLECDNCGAINDEFDVYIEQVRGMVRDSVVDYITEIETSIDELGGIEMNLRYLDHDDQADLINEEYQNIERSLANIMRELDV